MQSDTALPRIVVNADVDAEQRCSAIASRSMQMSSGAQHLRRFRRRCKASTSVLSPHLSSPLSLLIHNSHPRPPTAPSRKRSVSQPATTRSIAFSGHEENSSVAPAEKPNVEPMDSLKRRGGSARCLQALETDASRTDRLSARRRRDQKEMVEHGKAEVDVHWACDPLQNDF
ncbi:hypothetical protein GW17_00019001 [Ensete ventricosum]|nr:hypothetical protein GW17_00019001 [Ensete ventricosum]